MNQKSPIKILVVYAFRNTNATTNDTATTTKRVFPDHKSPSDRGIGSSLKPPPPNSSQTFVKF